MTVLNEFDLMIKVALEKVKENFQSVIDNESSSLAHARERNSAFGYDKESFFLPEYLLEHGTEGEFKKYVEQKNSFIKELIPIYESALENQSTYEKTRQDISGFKKEVENLLNYSEYSFLKALINYEAEKYGTTSFNIITKLHCYEGSVINLEKELHNFTREVFDKPEVIVFNAIEKIEGIYNEDVSQSVEDIQNYVAGKGEVIRGIEANEYFALGFLKDVVKNMIPIRDDDTAEKNRIGFFDKLKDKLKSIRGIREENGEKIAVENGREYLVNFNLKKVITNYDIDRTRGNEGIAPNFWKESTPLVSMSKDQPTILAKDKFAINIFSDQLRKGIFAKHLSSYFTEQKIESSFKDINVTKDVIAKNVLYIGKKAMNKEQVSVKDVLKELGNTIQEEEKIKFNNDTRVREGYDWLYRQRPDSITFQDYFGMDLEFGFEVGNAVKREYKENFAKAVFNSMVDIGYGLGIDTTVFKEMFGKKIYITSGNGNYYDEEKKTIHIGMNSNKPMIEVFAKAFYANSKNDINLNDIIDLAKGYDVSINVKLLSHAKNNWLLEKQNNFSVSGKYDLWTYTSLVKELSVADYEKIWKEAFSTLKTEQGILSSLENGIKKQFEVAKESGKVGEIIGVESVNKNIEQVLQSEPFKKMLMGIIDKNPNLASFPEKQKKAIMEFVGDSVLREYDFEKRSQFCQKEKMAILEINQRVPDLSVQTEDEIFLRMENFNRAKLNPNMIFLSQIFEKTIGDKLKENGLSNQLLLGKDYGTREGRYISVVNERFGISSYMNFIASRNPSLKRFENYIKDNVPAYDYSDDVSGLKPKVQFYGSDVNHPFKIITIEPFEIKQEEKLAEKVEKRSDLTESRSVKL